MKPFARTDPLRHIPPPDIVEEMLAEAIRRCDLLRGLLRVARRKAAYDRPSEPSRPLLAICDGDRHGS